MATKKMRYWVDHMVYKHECFSYDDATRISIKHNGRQLKLIVPAGSPKVKSYAVAENDGLLMIVGEMKHKWNGENLGIVMVAKKRRGNEYEVGVWHALYPWALKHFGFVPRLKN